MVLIVAQHPRQHGETDGSNWLRRDPKNLSFLGGSRSEAAGSPTATLPSSRRWDLPAFPVIQRQPTGNLKVTYRLVSSPIAHDPIRATVTHCTRIASPIACGRLDPPTGVTDCTFCPI